MIEAVVFAEGAAELETLELGGFDDAAEDHGVVELSARDDGAGAGLDDAEGAVAVSEGLVDVVAPGAEAVAAVAGSGGEEAGAVVAG
ncbi:MAG: hypothetical protein JNL21_20265 [Myxococcales bacterium]|nr:hypothetical protein [Myxococcales bacterium]